VFIAEVGYNFLLTTTFHERKLQMENLVGESLLLSPQIVESCNRIAQVAMGLLPSQVIHIAITRIEDPVGSSPSLVAIERLGPDSWSVEIIPGFRFGSQTRIPELLGWFGWELPEKNSSGRRLIGPHREGQELNDKGLAVLLGKATELLCIMQENFEELKLTLVENVQEFDPTLAAGFKGAAKDLSLNLSNAKDRKAIRSEQPQKVSMAQMLRSRQSLSLAKDEAEKGRFYMISANHRGEPRSMFMLEVKADDSETIYRWQGSRFVKTDLRIAPTREGDKSNPAFPGGPSQRGVIFDQIADIWPEALDALGLDVNQINRNENSDD
jgi:hypothetical protein